MDPIIVVLICAASFGVAVTIAGFVRQLILSRDKNLNDEAQGRAWQQKADQFKQMREQLLNNRRFPNYEKVLGENKERVIYLENKMDEVFHKKSELLKNRSEYMAEEAREVINGPLSKARNEHYSRLYAETDMKIAFCDADLKLLQGERAVELKRHSKLNDYLLKKEEEVEVGMRDIWKQHASLLAKNALRSIENTEHVAVESINAGTLSFQSMIMAPLNFLIQYFSPTAAVSLPQVLLEQVARYKIAQLQSEMHTVEVHTDHLTTNNDVAIDPDDELEEENNPQPAIA